MRLTKEDKDKFKEAVKTMKPSELIELHAAITICGLYLNEKDKRFCFSHIGQRCERLLRNVVKNNSWD